MAIYNFSEKRIDRAPILIGAIMGTDTDEKRFLAMKQLFDIGMKRFKDRNSVISDSEFTYAESGSVALLPEINTAMYEKHTVDYLYSKNGNLQHMPASVTKVMTTIVGLPYIGNIGECITIEEDDVIGGSGNYFNAGDVLTIKDLIYSMMLPSSNTTATAYARYVGKILLNDENATLNQCLTAFYSAMMEKTNDLNMVNSVWTSVIGGRDTTQTTTNDLLKLIISACSYNTLCRIWNKKTYNVNIRGENARTQLIETTVTNNVLEANYYIYGGKTGQSGSDRALVMVAEPIGY